MLDIGCGEGYFSRFFAKEGAEVIGIDISDNLINAAREEEQKHPLGVKYFVADAAKLAMLDSKSFDVAFCYMALADIANYEGTIMEAARVLKRGGEFVVVIPHPCFTWRFLEGKMISGWETRLSKEGVKE